jgi:hypothetical protein
MNVYAARLRVLEQYVGADAISTVRTELYLAQLELKAGKIDVAARRLLDAQRRVSASYGASSPTALEVSMVVTKWLAGVGRYAEIEALTVDTNRRENDVLGAKSETSIVASFNEGFVKAHLGRPDGFGIASDAAKRASDVLGSTDPTAVHMRETLPSLQGK